MLVTKETDESNNWINSDRRGLLLPAPHFLQQRLLDHGLDFGGSEVDWKVGVPIVGAALVQELGDAGFDCMSPETSVLFQYYRTPVDASKVRIVDAFAFGSPVYVTKRIYGTETQRRNALNSGPLNSAGKGGFLGHQLFIPCGVDVLKDPASIAGQRGGQASTLHDAFLEWGLHPSMEQAVTLSLPHPVAHLACLGKWTDLLFLDRSRYSGTIRQAWGSPSCPAREAAHRPLDAQGAGVGAADLDAVAGHIRRWAKAVLANAEAEDDKVGEKMALERSLSVIKTLADSIRGGARIDSRLLPLPPKSIVPLQAHRRDSRALMQCVLLRSLLRDGRHLQEVVRLSLGVGIPRVVLGSSYDGVWVAPSRSAVWRSEFFLDCALMMLLRQHESTASSSQIRYGWADASPQSGRDWLLAKAHICPTQQLVSAMAAANQLALNSPPAPATRSLLPDAEEARLERELDQFHEHVCVPMALGSGYTSIADKASALLHSHTLESPTINSLSHVLGSYVSYTTDLGTEVGLPAFQVRSLRSMLPQWYLPEELDVEEDEPIDVNGPASFMPRCIIVGGALHVLHNLCGDLHTVLQHWETFFGQLKVVEPLLKWKFVKDRYIGTCIIGSPKAG